MEPQPDPNRVSYRAKRNVRKAPSGVETFSEVTPVAGRKPKKQVIKNTKPRKTRVKPERKYGVGSGEHESSMANRPKYTASSRRRVVTYRKEPKSRGKGKASIYVDLLAEEDDDELHTEDEDTENSEKSDEHSDMEIFDTTEA